MRRFVILLLLFSGTMALGQHKKNLEPTDIFAMEYISDPQISPDGSQVVYVRNFKDIMTDKNHSNLWLAATDGSLNRPLTTGNHNDAQPRWSHGGDRIVFTSNREDGRSKLYVMWMDTKETAPLTNTPKTPSGVSWSADDRYLAFTMFVTKKEHSIIQMPAAPEGATWNAPPVYIDRLNYRGDGRGYLKNGNTQIFTLPLDGGTPKQWTDAPYDHGAPVWSKDGKTLYFSANDHPEEAFEPNDSEIYALNLNNGAVRAITDRYGPDRAPALSPDGSKLAYLGLDDRFLGYQPNELYVRDLKGGEPQLITGDFDRNISNIQWARDGKGLYFQYDDKGETKIALMSLGGKVTDMVGQVGGLSLGRPYNAGDFSLANNGNLAYTLGTTEHPADLGVHTKKGNKRLTFVNDDLFAARNLGKVEALWWKSSHDQRDIQGWVVTPPNFDPNKKYPLILEIHGGPFTSYGFVYSAEIQAFAAAGYVVLYANPRGSTSYGKEFGNLIHHNYPSNDYEDLMSGVDAVIEKGYVDPEQLFVTGGSGGGVLTAWIVGKTDRFKAAVVAKPVINWASFVLYADNPAFFAKYWFGKKPWEDPEAYFKRSPLNYVANISTPTMLLTGEEDHRTPIAESEQFYTALKLEGVETALVRIPGASHGIANRPSNLVAKIAGILAWFEKYRGTD
ncbi:S9 family peptidase [Maribacter sp. 2307ULW6-5]|uniref:S9 family peptidase n=1 Tax=Maribacter sp. 2307ULW6-5 TaxID=3386275 RepID=UPI0039BD20DD